MSIFTPPIVCRDPAHDEWFRVKPGDERMCTTPTLREPETGELYLVKGDLWPLLGPHALWVSPRICVNHRGELFVWAVPVLPLHLRVNPDPGPAGLLAELAAIKWTKAAYDVRSGKYFVGVADKRENLPPPSWPELGIFDALEEAFRGRVIATYDHPLLRGGRRS